MILLVVIGLRNGATNRMSDLIVLILAAGEGKRWGQAANKVLVDIYSEPLIVRTHRMAQKIFGVTPITITKHKDVAEAVGFGNYFLVGDTRWTVETLFGCLEIWGPAQENRVIVLLGDTYYTTQTLNLIKHTTLPLCYFGRLLEIYAMQFYDHMLAYDMIVKALRHAQENQDVNYRPGRLWHTYYALHGYPMDTHTIPPDGDGTFIRLFESDITMDIDYPMDYRELLDKI